MKKILIIAIGIILLVAIVLGIVFLLPSKNASGDTIDFSKTNATDFFKELDEKGTEYTKLDEGSYIIPEQVVMNTKADVYIQVHNDKIVEATSNYLLFSDIDYSNDFGAVQDDESAGLDGMEEEIETEDANAEIVKEYKYSSKEKKEIQSEIDNLKKSFETKLGCGELTNYSLTPFIETEGIEIPDDDLEKVLKGYYQMECSVRDKEGRLWFLWIYSPYTGVMKASVTMIDSPDKYQDFEPIINMQQQSNTQTEGE